MKLPITLFASSFTIVVAAGLVQLDAGPETDGPAARPALHELTVDGKQVEVSLDRERVPAGDTVTLAIVAGDGAAGERLNVALLEQTGSLMSRSMPPPRLVLEQQIVVGSEPTTVALKLGGSQRAAKGRPDPLLTAGRATQYTIQISGLDKHGDQPAYLPVFAYEPEAYRMEIEPIAAGAPGTAVDVAVKVTSLAGKPLRGITIGGSSELVTIEEPATIATLAPGAQQVVHLRGTRVATEGAQATIHAYGYAEYGGTAGAWAKLDAASGALIARASQPAADQLLMMGL